MGLGQVRGPSWETGSLVHCPNQMAIVDWIGEHVCDGTHRWFVMKNRGSEVKTPPARKLGQSTLTRGWCAQTHTFARNANVWGTRRIYFVGPIAEVRGQIAEVVWVGASDPCADGPRLRVLNFAPMSDPEIRSRVLSLLLSLYVATVGIAAAYYNWDYARTNGFLRWVIFGEMVPTAKAIVWPYFAFHSDPTKIANPGRTELEQTRLTTKQISEMEVKKFILAINYSQQAAYLLNSAPRENLEDYPNLQDILTYRVRQSRWVKPLTRMFLITCFQD